MTFQNKMVDRFRKTISEKIADKVFVMINKNLWFSWFSKLNKKFDGYKRNYSTNGKIRDTVEIL